MNPARHVRLHVLADQAIKTIESWIEPCSDDFHSYVLTKNTEPTLTKFQPTHTNIPQLSLRRNHRGIVVD